MSAAISNHTLMYAPVRGGVAIQNPAIGNFGTAGFVATSDGNDRWIVSCYHVLCRASGEMPQNSPEPIFYPFDLARRNPIGLASTDRADKELDCAAALVPSRLALGQILGIGRLAAPAQPAVGMRVLKSGAVTGVTEGFILKVTETEIEVAPFGMPERYELTEEGDSGALWVDADTHAPVALHFRGSRPQTPERAFARPIQNVLDTLKLQLFIEP